MILDICLFQVKQVDHMFLYHDQKVTLYIMQDHPLSCCSPILSSQNLIYLKLLFSFLPEQHFWEILINLVNNASKFVFIQMCEFNSLSS